MVKWPRSRADASEVPQESGVAGPSKTFRKLVVPAMTRSRCALASLAFVALLLSACMTTDETNAFNMINNERQARGIPALAQQLNLITKAQKWARTLLDTSGGVCSGSTLRHSNLADGAPAGWRSLGENVGCALTSSPGTAVTSIHNAFMGSSGHKANIVSWTFNNGGVGLASSQLPNGLWLTFEAQEFAQL